MGDAIVADVRLTLEALLAILEPVDREPPGEPLPDAGARRRRWIRSTPTTAHQRPARGLPRGRDRRPRVALGDARAPQPAPPLAARAATTSAPAAASASASPRRSGCSSRSPTARSSASSARARPSTRSPAFWSAAAYEVPVTFLVLRNAEYAILKWFAGLEEVEGAPGARPAGADLPRRRRGLRRPGTRGRRRRDELIEATGARAIGSDRPEPGRGPGRSPGCGSSERRVAMPLLSPSPQRLAPRREHRGDRPGARRARRRHRPSRCARELAELVGDRAGPRPGDRPRPLRLRREPLPAAAEGGRARPATPTTSRRLMAFSRARAGSR